MTGEAVEVEEGVERAGGWGEMVEVEACVWHIPGRVSLPVTLAFLVSTLVFALIGSLF